MLKFFTNPASKYAYLRTFERQNVMIWSTLEGGELVKGITMNFFLKFVPSGLLKSLNQNNN